MIDLGLSFLDTCISQNPDLTKELAFYFFSKAAYASKVLFLHVYATLQSTCYVSKLGALYPKHLTLLVDLLGSFFFPPDKLAAVTLVHCPILLSRSFLSRYEANETLAQSNNKKAT